MTDSTAAFMVIGGLLTVSALLALVRVVRGPSVLDRVIATDVIVTIMVCALGAEAALGRHSTTLPILISLSLVGFIGSVAVARFVARDTDSPHGVPVEEGVDVSPDGRPSDADDLEIAAEDEEDDRR